MNDKLVEKAVFLLLVPVGLLHRAAAVADGD